MAEDQKAKAKDVEAQFTGFVDWLKETLKASVYEVNVRWHKSLTLAQMHDTKASVPLPK